MLKFKLADVIKAGLGIAMVDGGFLIAVQVIDFLLSYFGANFQVSTESANAVVTLSKAAILIAMLNILNLSVIIYRTAGLSRGIKYSPAICYQHALRRWPFLILFCFLSAFIMVVSIMPLIQLFTKFNPALNELNLLIIFMIMLSPFAVMATVFVIDQEKNPIQAILATFKMIKDEIGVGLLLHISTLYSLPFVLNGLIANHKYIPYMALFKTIWLLFCHILIVVVYASANVAKNSQNKAQSNTKVILA